MKRYELTFAKQKEETIEIMILSLFEGEMLEAIEEKLQEGYVLYYIEPLN